MAISTTSGSFSWTYTLNQICRRALRQVGAFEAGETPDAASIDDCVDALNAMVKEWMAIGIHVWTEEEGILFLQPQQYLYQLGEASPDHATDWQSWFSTSAALNATGATNTLTLNSTTNLASGQNIGVVLNSGGLFWTTINGAPTNGVVTLAAALPSDASSGAAVYAYAPVTPSAINIVRPLRVPAARRYAFNGAGNQPIETPMIRMSRKDYMDLPNKSSPTGSGTTTPTQFWYAPKVSAAWSTKGVQQGPGEFAVWPPPTDESSAIRFTWYRPIQDFINPGDIPDLPVEWTNALVRGLALEIAPEYDVLPARYAILEKRLAQSMELVTGWDREPEPVMFGVAYDPSSAY